jgi:pilus assembly protein CpaE
MLSDVLNISILFGSGVPDSSLPKLIENLPLVQLVGQSEYPEEFLAQRQGPASDLVMVYMNGNDSLPGWLEHLTASLPQTAVLLCSEKMDPEFLLKAMRSGVREVVPLPLTQEKLAEAFDRVRATRRRVSEATSEAGTILAVTGSKGGAGATTVAVNLSLALARSQEGKVVLVDLGRPFPDVGNFLDRDSMYTLFDLIQNQETLDLAFMERIVQPYEKNLSFIHGITDFNDQDSLNLEGIKRILTILKAQYRWVVVDLSHWLDGLFLQVIQDADLVVMLVELSVPNLRNLGHLWPLLRSWLRIQERVKLVVNRYDRSNGLSLGNLEQIVKQKPYFTLPNDYKHVSEAINRGIPLPMVAPKSKLWSSLETLASRLQGQLQPGDEVREASPRRRFWII